jgi:hypothetical protein
MADDDSDDSSRNPRSIAETISAEKLDIELENHDPVMEDVEGVEMPAPDEDDEPCSAESEDQSDDGNIEFTFQVPKPVRNAIRRLVDGDTTSQTEIRATFKI